ncbi:MAG: hypothetical protein HYY24_23605 [Verrucomicrobia bacterium]|nr:hypothetical protein [Verrucomicrobiota bacterium]
MSLNKSFALLLLPLVLAGCTSIHVTNLTPRQLPRDTNGLYPFEVAWRSNQRSLLRDSIKAYVVVGAELYPMQPVPVVKDRWETLVPIPASEPVLHYHYKFDFDYASIAIVRSDSKRSRPYLLQIEDK